MEFRTFSLCGCRHGTQCIPQENMKSAAGFLSVWFLCLQGFFVPSLARKPTAVHIFLLNTLCTLRLFQFMCAKLFSTVLFICTNFFIRSFAARKLLGYLFYAKFAIYLFRAKLIYSVTHAALKIESSTHNDVLVIRCIIIRRCISGRFICICRLVYGVTEE